MLERVGEGLLDDAVGGLRRGGREPVEAAREPAGHGEAGAAGPAYELVHHGQAGRPSGRQLPAQQLDQPADLILTTFDADEYVYEALRAGASGFLLKDAPADQLITAVRSLAAGDALIDPVITRRLISRFALAARGPAGLPDELRQLTARELEVLRLVAPGLSNVEIARELVVEENTVKTHVSRILMKLGLRDRVQAVVLAYELGFVTPEARG